MPKVPPLPDGDLDQAWQSRADHLKAPREEHHHVESETIALVQRQRYFALLHTIGGDLTLDERSALALACQEDASLYPIIREMGARNFPVIAAYAHRLASLERRASRLFALYEGCIADFRLAEEDFRTSLRKDANRRLHNFHAAITEFAADPPEESAPKIERRANAVIAQLRVTDTDLTETEEFFDVLIEKRQPLTDVDFARLPTVQMIGPMTTDELKSHPCFESVQKGIRGFPETEREVFFPQTLHDEAARFYMIECEGRMLAGFFITFDEGAPCIDWLMTPPDSPVKGTAETALLSFLRKLNMPHFICSVKEHVKIMSTMIELAGCVATGTIRYEIEVANEDGAAEKEMGNEEQSEQRTIVLCSDTYVRCEYDANEMHGYASKRFAEDDLGRIRNACKEPNTLYTVRIGGKAYLACKTTFHGKTYKDDIVPLPKATIDSTSTHEGKLFVRENKNTIQQVAGGNDRFLVTVIDRLCKNGGSRLARYFPAKENDANKHEKTYYGVFEMRPGAQCFTAPSTTPQTRWLADS